jgi:hypothetical protein
MTIPDLVADPGLVQRLIGEGETLFVERKERDPKAGSARRSRHSRTCSAAGC